MHPDIVEFYRKIGYEVIHKRPINSNFVGSWRDLYYLFNENGLVELAGVSNLQEEYIEQLLPCTYYLYNGKEYSEDEMLKIVKLKAFL